MPSHLPDIIGAVLFGVLLQSLIRLHRLKEWHHGYYGAALCLDVAVFGWSAWFAWLGVALLLDDTVQHAVEAFGRRPRMADFTPIHRLGAWIIRSGHGVGKTTVARVAHHLPCADALSAEDGLHRADVRAAVRRARRGDEGVDEEAARALRTLFTSRPKRSRLAAAPDESFISFRTSRPEVPEALAGVHSDNVLLIGDEASGIPAQVFERPSARCRATTRARRCSPETRCARVRTLLRHAQQAARSCGDAFTFRASATPRVSPTSSKTSRQYGDRLERIPCPRPGRVPSRGR
jgi:hypothetical protein